MAEPWIDLEFPGLYEKCLKMPIDELAEAMAHSNQKIESVARAAYEHLKSEQQDKYNKEQIELQHQRNTELVERQGRWLKWSAILTAVSTLTAAIAGSLVTYMLTRPPQQQATRVEIQQETALNTKNTTSEIPPVQRPDKAPLSPPK